MEPNISIVYFSPTGGSKKSAAAIAATFGETITDIDLTRYDARPPKTDFDRDDLVVFGAPVYGGRLYRGCHGRLAQVRGNQTPCILTVTYGNRAYEDALLELFDLATAQGFVPVAAAALVGQHTYGKIQVGRPNEQDILEDQEFAAKVQLKLEQNDLSPVTVPGNHPYRDGIAGGKGGKFRPLTGEACIQCGICAELCPEGAIDPEDCSKIDGERCISCFCCIRRCPTHAKNMDTEEYQGFSEMFNQMLANRRENEYFL